MSKLAGERREYEHGRLDVSDVAPDPLSSLARWVDEALERGAPEPTAMVLATVSESGAPSARVILCKGLDAAGLTFYTSYESRKGRELSTNPSAAATFFWPALERQARVEGVVEAVSPEQSERYFHSRPRGSQLAALASRQSQPLPARALLDAELARLEAAHPDVVPLPHGWGGYLLRPLAIEFWQGRPSRLHDRIRFERTALDQPWLAARLYP